MCCDTPKNYVEFCVKHDVMCGVAPVMSVTQCNSRLKCKIKR